MTDCPYKLLGEAGMVDFCGLYPRKLRTCPGEGKCTEARKNDKENELAPRKPLVTPYEEYIGGDYAIWHCGFCGCHLQYQSDDTCPNCGRKVIWE